MGTPVKRQYPVEAGEVIGRKQCSCCGRTVEIKIAASSVAYYQCGHADEQTGVPCSHHERWGHAKSAEMRKAYLIKTGQLQEIKTPKPANLNRPPAANLNQPPAKSPESAKLERENAKSENQGGDDYGLGL